MKKIMAVLLAVCCVMTAMPVSALVPENRYAYSSLVQTEDLNNVAEEQAEMLKALGLFIGSNKGFELNRNLTRAEAAILITRFMGEEGNALAQENAHPFTDVPSWADKQVGWLYQNQITAGVGGNRYGSTQSVTYWQLATMLCRVMTGEDDFVGYSIGTQAEQEACESVQDGVVQNKFTRAEVVGMLTRFLRCSYIKDGAVSTVAQSLAEKGIFTAEQLVKAGVTVYPIDYGYTHGEGKIYAKMAGVRFAESRMAGFFWGGEAMYPPTELPYIYSWKYEEKGLVIYQLDCLTLAATEVGFLLNHTDTYSMITYYGTVSGRDYFGLRYAGSTRVKLLCVEGNTTTVMAEGAAMSSPYRWGENSLAISVDTTMYVITKDGVRNYAVAQGARLVGVDYHGTAVFYHEADGFGVIEAMRRNDGVVTETYKVDLSDPRINADASILEYRASGDGGLGPMFYGEAGLFCTVDGYFMRITDRPTLDVAGLRIGASAGYAILSHEPGSYIGNSIYRYHSIGATIGDAGCEEILGLQNVPQNVLVIDSISGADSAVFLTAKHPVGMEKYDVFTYASLYVGDDGDMTIAVLSFSPGRPEISFAEHDEEWYVRQEQERLNALGYGYGDAEVDSHE